MAEVKSICEMSIEEKKAMVDMIYVSYPRIQAISKKIQYCQDFSKVSAEPECLFIYGPTGAGKTTIRKEHQNKYPKKIVEDGVFVPVLSAVIPIPATVKSLATKLLKEIGDPMFERGTTSSQTLRLTKLIQDCGVELIILDELQHFIDRDSQKVLQTVSDWLKTILEDTGVPIVLVGLPEAEGVLNANPQLSRRFANRVYLEPFKWDSPENILEFRKFLYAIDSKLPLNEKAHLADQEMAARFYYASDGVVSYVMNLIRHGTRIALDNKTERLTLDVLAESFEQHVKADKKEKENPFLYEHFDMPIPISRKGAPSGGKATNLRVKARKPKLKVPDVLR